MATILCYIHNTGDQIIDFVETILKIVNTIYSSCEIILVNDYSDETTTERVREVENNLPENVDLTVIETDCFSGIDKCILFAMKYSIGDYVIEFDSPSFSDTETVLKELIEKTREGHDAVIAIPNHENIYIKTIRKLCASELGLIHDSKAGMFSRRFVNKIYDLNNGEELVQVIYHQIGYPVNYINCARKEINNGREIYTRRKKLYWKTILYYSNFNKIIVCLEFLLVIILGIIWLITKLDAVEMLFQLVGICSIVLDFLIISEYARIDGVTKNHTGKCKGWLIHKARGR